MSPTATPTKSPPNLPKSHHAFLLVTAVIHDPGRGELVELELDDGTRLRCTASPEALRLGTALAGRWRLTVHFRTRLDGSLINPVRMVNLRPPREDDNETIWSASGQVVRLDQTNGLAVLRVYPERAKLEPFIVAAEASLEQLTNLEDVYSVHMRGTLRGNVLVAQQLERVALTVPARWAAWKPTQVRREVQELVESQRDRA